LRRRLSGTTRDVDGGEATGGGGGRLTPGFEPAARQDAPVRATEIGVAQGVAERIHRAVDVAQPVPCNISPANSASRSIRESVLTCIQLLAVAGNLS